MNEKLRMERSDETVIRLYREDGEYVAYSYSALRLKDLYPSVQLVKHYTRGKAYYLSAAIPVEGRLARQMAGLHPDDGETYLLELPARKLEEWQTDPERTVPDLVLYPEQEKRGCIARRLYGLLHRLMVAGYFGRW